MKTEQLVCTYETPKALWDAGIRMETHFCWDSIQHRVCYTWNVPKTMIGEEFYPAPTASEIGERLPDGIEIGTLYFELMIYRRGGKWIVSYTIKATFSNESLSEAMAQMLLWLQKNGLLKGEKK